MAKKIKKKKKNKPNIWNILLLAVILAIAGLAVALVGATTGRNLAAHIQDAAVTLQPRGSSVATCGADVISVWDVSSG